MTNGNTQSCRVRVSLRDGLLEVEGPDAFVREYAEDIAALLARVPVETPAYSVQEGATSVGRSPRQGTAEFPEALHRLKTSSGTDQILLAASFGAKANADDTFGTNEANRLLIEQGIKLANPSQSMANNLKAKRVFKVGNRWRISRTGHEYLQSIVG